MQIIAADIGLSREQLAQKYKTWDNGQGLTPVWHLYDESFRLTQWIGGRPVDNPTGRYNLINKADSGVWILNNGPPPDESITNQQKETVILDLPQTIDYNKEIGQTVVLPGVPRPGSIFPVPGIPGSNNKIPAINPTTPLFPGFKFPVYGTQTGWFGDLFKFGWKFPQAVWDFLFGDHSKPVDPGVLPPIINAFPERADDILRDFLNRNLRSGQMDAMTLMLLMSMMGGRRNNGMQMIMMLMLMGGLGGASQTPALPSGTVV